MADKKINRKTASADRPGRITPLEDAELNAVSGGIDVQRGYTPTPNEGRPVNRVYGIGYRNETILPIIREPGTE